MSILGRGRRVTPKPFSNPRISAGFNGHPSSQTGAGRASRPRPLQPYPEQPTGSLTLSQRNRYGRELAASIRDGTAPLLITGDEVCHALDVKRVPADLDCVTAVPGGKHQGPDLYRSADVRCRL
jgi:hypothetical protein